MMKGIFILLALANSGLSAPSLEEYLKLREDILAEELTFSLGWDLTLSLEEETFNQLLMAEKEKEMADSFNSAKFPPSYSFLETWEDYEKSSVFQLIKKIPKGSILHVHDIAMASVAWLVKNATYRDNLYLKQTEEALEFRFMLEPQEDWESVADLRQDLGEEQVDSWITSKLMMGIGNERYETVNDVWNKFRRCLGRAFGIITYKPVFRDYFEQALKEYLEDGVQYVEFRTTLPPVYDLDGSSLNPLEVALLYKEVSEQFARENPTWCGSKLIFAPIRHVSETTVREDLVTARQLAQAMPAFFAGFDLVAQEDLGSPLLDFLEPLLEASQDVEYFFHAGETAWDWSSTDLNLVDALMLNTSRIGHGYAILKHPKLLDIAREKDIPIEVNPLSNQVLGLVSDLRNHPAASLVKTSFPMVISSDDPVVWGALPLSHDMYAAFTAFGGDSSDLRFLKKLILNSFRYSKMDGVEKDACAAKFARQWSWSIKDILVQTFPDVSIL